MREPRRGQRTWREGVSGNVVGKVKTYKEGRDRGIPLERGTQEGPLE